MSRNTDGTRKTDGPWTLWVDERACLGSGQCVGAQPWLFALGRDRRARLSDGTAEPAPDLLDTARSCPGQAIHVTDNAGHQLAPDD